MAINLSDNLTIGVGAPIDNKYLNGNNAPYATTAEVISTIPISKRYQGLTVNILSVEYWFKDGVADGNLIIKGGSGSGSGQRIEQTFTKNAHGFIVGNVLAYSGTIWIKAIADGSQNNIETIGVVSEIPNVNQFTVVFAGYVQGFTSAGLLANKTYYLSTSVAGQLTTNDTQVFGNVSKPILTTLTIDNVVVFQYRGLIVTSGNGGGGGSTSGITEIINIGAGTGEIFKVTSPSISGQTSELRTILGSGGTTVVTNGNTIIVNSDSSGLYTLSSPSNITVGGMPNGTVLTGLTSNDLLQQILVATFYPTFITPNNTFSDDATNTQEVGVTAATINFTATFSRGTISPAYTTSGNRSGLPNRYNYTGTGLPATVNTNLLNDGQIINNYIILLGANTWTNSVRYDAGEQPLDSNFNPYSTPLSSGTTGTKSTTITGIYPWFYGKVASGGALPGANRPLSDQALINSGTKVVATSDNTVIVNDFTSTADDYIWIAIPNASADKTVWYVNGLNNGIIGGSISPSGNLFPNEGIVNVNSPTALWSSVSYKIYISNLQTTASYMEFRNS